MLKLYFTNADLRSPNEESTLKKRVCLFEEQHKSNSTPNQVSFLLEFLSSLKHPIDKGCGRSTSTHSL
jgi:hypothetical protein